MRIALVTSGLPLGGTTTFSLYLARALVRVGATVEVFSYSMANPLGQEFSSAGITVHTQDEVSLIFEDRLQDVHVRLCVFRPQIVIAVMGAEAFETLRYVPTGVLRIGMFHDQLTPTCAFGPRYRESMDCLVAVAPYLRDELLQLESKLPCTYLPHGIPLPEENAIRSKNSSAPIRILYYGRLENISKGVRIFPEIITALDRRKVPFTFTIHGQGPEEEFLRKSFAGEKNRDRIRFSSPVTSQELSELIRQHDVFLLTSYHEGGPLALLEAMALGLVPVCGDIPCLIQEVVNPNNGFRVPRGEAEAYANAVALLDADHARLEQMSRAARAAIVADFSEDAMAHRYLALIKSLKVPVLKAAWLERIQVRPILGGNPLIHWRPMRAIRRFIKTLRK